MNFSRILSVCLILIGGFIAFYAESGTGQNTYLLIGGIFMLMMGVYRISRNIPSKFEDDHAPKRNDDEF